ncbi:uncharacterized protein BT62DRAFT_374187 [Guyanagaster necrorhizus]|uniref:Uncharacterized protein n=1 Tax=Guyanagaster necrorhizus TaxID=856835 RepID=A0A9P7VLZ6_9AGAR|nr:uncharacterized protein BT62DRAFT_374187 [Guyanagaster necrorhizus MCA 3950]KAG7442785.1 hypothetical protein BT62DRAFT_374187 [Guyanagaster necrorhizus MCA 3950]
MSADRVSSLLAHYRRRRPLWKQWSWYRRPVVIVVRGQSRYHTATIHLCLLRSPRPTTKRDICSGSITRVGDLPRFCRCLRNFLLLPVRRRKMEDQASLCTLVAQVTDAFSPSPALVLPSRS